MGRPGEKLKEATPILTLGAGLIALFLGYSWWWMVFVVGWAVLTPLMGILFKDPTAEAIEEQIRADVAGSVGVASSGEPTDDGTGIDDREDALDLLRERYARGDLDEAEFERKVERLLETESLADAEVLLGRGDDSEGVSDDRGRRSGDYERETNDDREPATERS